MMFPASDTVPAGVPAFLGKLWILVDDPSNNDLIGWDPVSLLAVAILVFHHSLILIHHLQAARLVDN